MPAVSRSRAPARRPARRYKPATYIRGRGAYTYRAPARRYKPSTYMKGRGGYYFKGSASASAKLPGFGNVSGSLEGGFSKGTTLRGLGAYDLNSLAHNVLIKPDLPEVRNSVYVEGGTIIRHREYLGTITTSSTANTFNIQSYPLNPAQSSTFPWLSSIAQNYEEYKPNGLMFEFRSTASDAIASSTNLALGQVMLCTQYDPTDPDFASDIEMLNYSWAQSGKVSDTVCHFIECDPKQSPLSHLYTRAGGLESDLRFTDFGKFSIATNGLQGTSVQVGQLWVTYEFIMYKPKVGGLGSEASSLFNYFQGDGSVSAAQAFGTIANGDLNPLNNLDIGLSYSGGGANTITFPARGVPATYSVSLTLLGDSTASVTSPSATVGSGASFIYSPYIYGSTVSKIALPTSTSTQSVQHLYYLVSVDGDGAVHTSGVSFGATIPDNAECTVIIEEVPYISP